jgi:IS30 family transposase
VRHVGREERAIWDTDESTSAKKGLVMRYHQITREERYTLATLRKQTPALTTTAIARLLGRHRSTVHREISRNSTHADRAYRPYRAQEAANGRRRRSRKRSHFTAAEWRLVENLLQADLSPQQVSGWLARHSLLLISHETIYKHVWRDKRRGGTLWRHLRQRPKYRKRYGTHEKRGRLAGKRHISERPSAIERRTEVGHWEMDTVSGSGSNHCIVTLVERATGCVLIAKLPDHTKTQLNRRVIQLIREQPHLFRTITVDNGSEFHGYEQIERATGVTFYFATPYHAWERGTNENTNGLIRQYLPKRTSLTQLSQAYCNRIANILNNRPRKRYLYASPLEQLALLGVSSRSVGVAVQS